MQSITNESLPLQLSRLSKLIVDSSSTHDSRTPLLRQPQESINQSRFISLNQPQSSVLNQLDQSFQQMSRLKNTKSEGDIKFPILNEQLYERKTLLRNISDRISDQLSLNYSIVSKQLNDKKQRVQLAQKHTRARMSKRRRKTESNIEQEDPRLSYFIPKSIDVKWEQQDSSSWCPAFREFGNICGFGNKAYLFGGIGADVGGQLVLFDVTMQRWKVELLQGDKLHNRHGHSMNWNRYLYIIGGEVCEARDVSRYMTQDIVKIDLEQKTCRIIKQTSLDARRNHTTVEVGKSLLICGGINRKNHLIPDLLIFSSTTYRTDKLQFEGDNPFAKGIAYHQSCPIFWPDRYRVTIYQKPEDDLLEGDEIKLEGVYFYGGVDSEQKVYDKLYVLNVYTYPAKFQVLKTTGTQPPPLTMHTMVHIEPKQYLVVYGGKVEDKITQINREIFVLNLKHCTWLQVEEAGLIPEERLGHCATTCENKMIVFGGVNLDGYLSPKWHVLDLNWEGHVKVASKPKTRERRFNYVNTSEPIVTVSEPKDQESDKRHQLIIELSQNSHLLSLAVSPMNKRATPKNVRFGSSILHLPRNQMV